MTDNTNGTGDETGAYEGTRLMNRAFLDRAAITIKLDFLEVAKEAAALVSRSGCPQPLALTLCKFAKLTRDGAHKGNVSHGLTFRRLVPLAQLLVAGCAANEAFQLCVVETAPADDREVLRQLWTADGNTQTITQQAQA